MVLLVHQIFANNTLSITFCPTGLELGLGVRVPLTRLLFFKIGLKVVGKKNGTKRHGQSVIGRPPTGAPSHTSKKSQEWCKKMLLLHLQI